MFIRRWLREFTEFMFSKGNALDLAIAHLQQIVNSLTNDLIMPLLNPLVPKGDWKGLNIPYFGGEILLGKLIDVTINSWLLGGLCFYHQDNPSLGKPWAAQDIRRRVFRLSTVMVNAMDTTRAGVDHLMLKGAAVRLIRAE